MTHHSPRQIIQPANASLLRYLGVGRADAGVPLERSPASVSHPYYTLGTHPDLMARLWEQITVLLPADCRWVVYNTPVLVHPRTDIIFAFAGGTHTYALRLPTHERHEALDAGATQVQTNPNPTRTALAIRTVFELRTIGEEWVFGHWHKCEDRWCLAAYEFAGQAVEE